MPFNFNHQLWLSTKRDIRELIKKQNLLKKREPIEDITSTFTVISEMHIMYTELVAKLAYLYRETFQIQKKDVVRNLLDPALKRLIELKNKLKAIQLSEFVYLDKFLIERKLTPYDLVFWSSSFVYSRTPKMEALIPEPQQHSKKLLEEVVAAIIKIQSHERARKARTLRSSFDCNNSDKHQNMRGNISYTFTKKSDISVKIPIKRTVLRSNFIKSTTNICRQSLLSEHLKGIKTHVDFVIEEELANNASIIQKAWKSYKAKKILRMKINNKKILYGMKKSKKLLKSEEIERRTLEENQKYLHQNQLNADYTQVLNAERVKLLQQHRTNIMEDISDHVRDWFREFYEKTGDFHPYPDAIEGGTVSLLLDETMNVDEFREYQKKQNLSKGQEKSVYKNIRPEQDKKANEEKEKLTDIKEQRKLATAYTYDVAYELRSNENIKKIEKTISQFSIEWRNVDEYLNKQHCVIRELVAENALATIHRELRILVDQYMRTEYDLLKTAWCADNKVKFKSSMTRRRGKTNKKIVKTPCDVTTEPSIEFLYEELLTAQIIDSYPRLGLGDYLGDFNFLADDLRADNNLISLDPAKADIKVAVQDVLFGMGAFDLAKPKALCLVGPANNGKKLLCNIIAAELGALFINLSPEKTFHLAGRLKYFVTSIMKVAKALQPTIIFIEDAHRIFWRKIPKDQVNIHPTLLKNALAKDIIKSIGKKDKIMVIGTSSLPWSSSKKFQKVFENILIVPESDYGTIYIMWLKLLTQTVGSSYLDDSISSVLAKVFQKYNTGDIVNSVINCLNIDRRSRLHSNPLNPNEFLEYFLSQSIPLFATDKKISEKYKNWYNKTANLGKVRLMKQSEKLKK